MRYTERGKAVVQNDREILVKQGWRKLRGKLAINPRAIDDDKASIDALTVNSMNRQFRDERTPMATALSTEPMEQVEWAVLPQLSLCWIFSIFCPLGSAPCAGGTGHLQSGAV